MHVHRSGTDLILYLLCFYVLWSILTLYSQTHQQTVQVCLTASQVASQTLTVVYWVVTRRSASKLAWVAG